MSRVLLVARREWLEQARQPAMLAVITATFTLISGLVVAVLIVLEVIAADPSTGARMARWLPGFDAATATGPAVSLASFLLFAQYLGISAVMAGHAVLHERQSHTLAFLLLAPLRRGELLAGKVLGAVGPATALYVVLAGAAFAVAGSLEVTAPHDARLPPSPAWAAGFFVGGPAWAVAVAAVCATVSSLARDVRTAQQGVWFVVLFATFGCGALLALPGLGAQLGVAVLGLAATGAALAVGAQTISRDLSG